MKKFILLVCSCFFLQFAQTQNTNTESDNRFSIKKLPVMGIPILGWNNYDKTMLGAAIFNFSDKNKFSFAAAPMYSFASKSIVGMGNIFYPIYSKGNFIDKIGLSLQVKSFNYNYRFDIDEHEKYIKIQPKIKINFRQQSDTSYTFHSLQYRFVYINQKYQLFNTSAQMYEPTNRSYYVNELKYLLENKRFSDLKLEASLQQGKGFLRLGAHLDQLIPYGVGEKGVQVHLFAGYLFDFDSPDVPAAFIMSGTTGFSIFQKDYLFDDVMLGRNDRTGIFSKQIFRRDANLKTLSNIAFSDTWMVGIGAKAALPGKLPIKPYFNAVIFPKTDFNGNVKSELAYSGGIALVIFPELFEVYFPLTPLESNNIKDGSVYQNLPGFFQRVTFQLNLKRINPFDYLDRLRRR